MASFRKFLLENPIPKMLYILRGISGSGKSSLSQKLGAGGAVFSTDDFFMQSGDYNFDANKFGEAHQWNVDRAVKAMSEGISPIVIDNTNTQAWEAKPYVAAAIQYGYQVEFAEPDTPWKFNAEELARRNKHGVPLDTIQQMINQWEPDLTVDKVMNSKSPYAQESH